MRLQKLTTQKEQAAPQLWAIASGKGGVGKTFISASLGLTLSKLGHNVVIIDLDLTGANLHTAIGVEPSHSSLRLYFEGSKTLKESVLPSPYPHLSYVQGFWDAWSPTELSADQIQKLLQDIKGLSADFVLLDMGPGSSESHLQLFKAAQEKILISTPEPTSIEKTYRFLESYICHSLKEGSQPAAFENMIKILRDHRKRILGSYFSFRSHLKDNPGFETNFFEAIASSPVRLMINSARSQSNFDLGFCMKSVCNKYYDLGIDFMGAVDYDNAVWQSVQNREPVLVAQPFTPLAGQFLTICKHLIDPSELRAVI